MAQFFGVLAHVARGVREHFARKRWIAEYRNAERKHWGAR